MQLHTEQVDNYFFAAFSSPPLSEIRLFSLSSYLSIFSGEEFGSLKKAKK